MTTVERILCPVDFSNGSRTALGHALALRHWYGATLTVLHVFSDVPIVDTTAAGLGAGLQASEAPSDAAAIEDRLRTFVSAASDDAGVEIMTCPGGSVREDILRHAAAMRADLIVLGSRGLTGLTRLALGSTAENVLRHSTMPVLIVPPHAPAQPHPGVPFKRIVVPLDFEADSNAVLTTAFDFAQQADAALTLLHVLHVPAARGAGAVGTGLDRETAHRALLQDARSRLEALIPERVRTYCSVHAEVTEGYPAEDILRLARERDADLIIMGVRGRNALDVTLFGSYTRAVLHASTCPVLTVRQG